jgi:alkaline phosphatase
MAKMRSYSFIILSNLILIALLANLSYGAPKNIIFMIGDGMGFEQVKAAGMYLNGEPGTLSFESLPYKGEVTTRSANNSATDSAAAATAYATGVKVNNEVISRAYPGNGSELETLLEYFKVRGKSTGLVTTVYITHATPAAFGAHNIDRDNLSQIANDYLNKTRPNVLFGGGGSDNGVTVSAFQNAGYIVVTNRDQMQTLDTDLVTMVSGQFADGYLNNEPNMGEQPHLSEMAVTALDILDNNPEGFFVMIEGGKIDEAGHANNRDNNILETVEFANTVQKVLDWAQGRDDTLIIVTADHETGELKVTKNNGAGAFPTVTWNSVDHTGVNVPLFAWGDNAQLISGVMDNTEMFWVCTKTPEDGAWKPEPKDGSLYIDTKVTLSWVPQKGAVSHNIYFSTNYDEVCDANANTFLINQTETTCLIGAAGGAYASALAPETTYYWRVDEINDIDPNNPYLSKVWSFSTPPAIAWNPSPSNGEKCVSQNAVLSWSAALGIGSVSPHKVYFGQNYNDVLNGASSASKGTFNEMTYTPGILQKDRIYYWRVDETIGDGRTKYIKKGNVWSFTVNEQILIDDFEMYNDMEPNRIFDTWIDGTNDYANGSRVSHILPDLAAGEHFAETNIVHSGNQSMPYYYSNNMIYSEATKILMFPRNWTENGVKNLSIWFRGNKLNIADEMYVSVSNIAGVPVGIIYDKPQDLQSETWTQWDINLHGFEDMGIDLTNVDKISIGFGDRDNLKIGGMGIVYFDDIKLYKPLEP